MSCVTWLLNESCVWNPDLRRLRMLMPPWHRLIMGWHCVCPRVPVLQEALMSALWIHLLLETCGPLKAALHRSLWTTGQKQAWDLPAHLYLRKFCFVVVATQPRADHFKAASRVDCRITGPPCSPRDQMRGAGSPRVIQRRLSVITRPAEPAHVPITAPRRKSHPQRRCVVAHLCRQIIS